MSVIFCGWSVRQIGHSYCCRSWPSVERVHYITNKINTYEVRALEWNFLCYFRKLHKIASIALVQTTI